ncbi:hypothetical protein ABT024_23835 [Streptomyces sp. NPDC002812]|uniref:hypothetical protein n=1 Tax=unclassified Streptomyces TaxID=2593676 RepID=UPI002030674B|nr:hypothetical protein [Streptomyces sp. G1]MCM1972177.1 hypothetical protein [Streptomyces sp. G1]MCX5300628.1 hypothetical protein [Streptomyces sp. NBC_00193]
MSPTASTPATPAAPGASGRRAVRRPPLLSAAGGPHPAALAAAALAAGAALLVAVRAGALTRLWDFLDYAAGVLSLVSLTGAVLWGLAATDRRLLASGHRLVAQAVHRGLAVAGLGFLLLHVWIKVGRSRTDAAAVILPFTDGQRPLLIGLGSLAGYGFVAVAVSGAVRGTFAARGRSLWWRALHMGAYPAWGASLVHGLKSGRAASGWVTTGYALCLLAVAGLLALRLRAKLRTLAVALPRTRPGTPLRAEAARPSGAPAAPPVQSPPHAPAVPSRPPGQAPPHRPAPFVRRPAEWAAELLTARLTRQPGTTVFPGRPGRAADPSAGPSAEPLDGVRSGR